METGYWKMKWDKLIGGRKMSRWKKNALFTEHEALYIGWDEFEKFVKMLLRDDEVTIGNDDMWYYKVRSGDETYDDNDMLPKIEEYLDTKFSSSHVDEHGVWFIFDK